MRNSLIASLLFLLLTSAAWAEVLPDPGDLTAYKDEKGGDRQYFQVTGTNTGSLWGTDLYTLDSKLSTAAVHAGVLKVGEQGVVQVTIKPGLADYPGTTRNGITSSHWSSYQGSYLVEKAPGEVSGTPPPATSPSGAQSGLAALTDSLIAANQAAKEMAEATGATPPRPAANDDVPNPGSTGSTPPEADPGNLLEYAGNRGKSMLVEVTGTVEGSVWGTGLYTLDSKLSTAAVHAGAVKVGERGVVEVIFVEGQPKYEGSTLNGVTSSSWGSYGESYTIRKPAITEEVEPFTGTLSAYEDRLGESFEFTVKGSTVGPAWGTDVYTLDSQLSVTAVHSGVLTDGETGKVSVTILKGLPAYQGSVRHGVTSQNWGAFATSYRVDKVRR